MANLAGQGLRLEVCASAAEAVRGADIVTTATADKTRAAILRPAMIEPGMHINAVGGDCPGKTELHRGVLEMGSVFVEFEPQSRIEGEIQQLPADFAVTEFWQVLAGHRPGRRGPRRSRCSTRSASRSRISPPWRSWASGPRNSGFGEAIELVANAADPEDLFGLLTSKPLAAGADAVAGLQAARRRPPIRLRSAPRAGAASTRRRGSSNS